MQLLLFLMHTFFIFVARSHMLSVVLENNCVPEEADIDRTSKKDDFLHGFGIRNIKKAVEKYAGQCLIRHENGCFQVKLLLPLPQ